MKINGKLNVEKWLEDSPFEICTSIEDLNLNLTKLGAIGYYNEYLYFRKNPTTVEQLVTVSYLSNIINSLDIEEDVTNNVTNNIVNNPTLINNIINSVLDNIINNNNFINSVLNSILSKINVEVRSLKGNTLFFAFDPNNLDITPPPILPPVTGICNNPTSVKLLGNFTPIAGSTETYNIEVVGSSEYLLTYSIVGGVATTSLHETPIQVVWDLDYNGLSSIGVGVGCVNDVVNSKYDFKFFTIGDKVSQEALDESIQNNSFRDSFKYGVTKLEAFSNTENIFCFFLGNFYGINDIMYSDSTLQTKVANGYYLKNNEYYLVINGVIQQIDNV